MRETLEFKVLVIWGHIRFLSIHNQLKANFPKGENIVQNIQNISEQKPLAQLIASLFIFILLCNCYGHGWVVLRQWRLLFYNIHLLTKTNPRIGVKIFIIEQMALFLCQCQHAQDQCVILKQTQFTVPTLNTLSCKNNFNFLPYNLLLDWNHSCLTFFFLI